MTVDAGSMPVGHQSDRGGGARRRRPSGLNVRKLAGIVAAFGLVLSSSACGNTPSEANERTDLSEMVTLRGPTHIRPGVPATFTAHVPDNAVFNMDVTADGTPCTPVEELLGTIPVDTGAATNACEGLQQTVRTRVPVDIAEVRLTVDGREGTDYLIAEELHNGATVLFAPERVLPGTVSHTERRITATVTLRLDGDAASPVKMPNLGTHPVQVERTVYPDPLEVPAVISMFTEDDFQPAEESGGFVVVKPTHGSIVRSGGTVVGDDPDTTCQDTARLVGSLTTPVEALSGFGSFLSFATGLGELQRANPFTGSHRTKCAVTNTITDLTTYGEIAPALLLRWPPRSHLTPGDSLRSLIMVGPPGTVAHFFNDRGWSEDQSMNGTGGAFTLTLGAEGYALVRSLRGRLVYEPSDVLCVKYEPAGWLFADHDVFSAQLSALSFDPVTVRVEGEPVDDCGATDTSVQRIEARPTSEPTQQPDTQEPDPTDDGTQAQRPTAPPTEPAGGTDDDEPSPTDDGSDGGSDDGSGDEEPADTAPTVTITSPQDGAEFEAERSEAGRYYVDVQLTATAADQEDGTPPGASVAWTTTADEHGTGQASVRSLGSGYQLTARLYVGGNGPTVHVLRVAVTDSAGNTTTDDISVTVHYVPG